VIEMKIIEKDLLIRDIEIYLEMFKTEAFKKQYTVITDMDKEHQESFIGLISLGLHIFLLDIKNDTGIEFKEIEE